MGAASGRLAGRGRGPVGGGRVPLGLAGTRPGHPSALRPRIARSDARIGCWTSGRWTRRADASLNATPVQWGRASWPLDAASGLRAKDQGSAGRLELLGPAGLVCHWRYTIGRSPAAHRLAQRFERLRQGELSGGEETGEPPTTVCPSCGAILAASQTSCPDCGVVKDKPALGALYRLAGFAKPHKWMVLLGFLLMVASSTAASGAALSHEAVDRQRLDPGRTAARQRRRSVKCGGSCSGLSGPPCWLGS